MINTLPQSLIEAAKKVLVESTSPRLHHIADVKTNFPDADYYVIRKGTPDTVGKITKEFSPEHIGVKINRTDVMDPRYHQYAMQYAHMNGYWKPKAKGALRLQHISVDDVKNMPALYQGLNESAEHPMIDVDGELKHRHNSDGIPIHHTDEGIRNFHRWFGNSKVVDKNGRPLVVYHGTRTSFDTFEHGKGKFTDTGVSGKGFYFTPKADYADAYGRDEHGANIMPVYLKLENPFIHKGSKTEELFTKFAGKRPNDYWNTDWSEKVTNGLKSIGHDGYMDSDYDLKNNGLEFVAFHSSQIKSTIGNSGTFSHPTRITEDAEHPMIDVDGELKHRHNSNGIPIHHTDEGIRNFHRWFGDSKVIDEHGRPMVAYHGTKNDIEKFDKRKSRTNKAFFFSPSPEFASSPAYTGHIAPPSKGGGNVMPVYLRIKSPKYVSDLSMNPMVESGAIESARSGGNDGIYVERGNYWIAMEQKSIKSAIGNNGDFHPKKPQINESAEEPRLHHVAEVKTNFPGADYYVVRKGTPDAVGKVTNEFSPEHIGVKITRTDVLHPKYHQYSMQYAHMNGYWKEKAKGVLRLQHISVDDVKNMPVVYRGLNESAEYAPSTHHFDPDQIEKTRHVGYKSRTKLINMPIDDFLSVAQHTEGVGDKMDGVKSLINSGTKFSSIPQLYVDATDNNDAHKVYGHEGRHRALALKQRGYTHIPVHIIHSSIRWSEQSNPARFDYKEHWPTKLIGEDNRHTIEFPVKREDSDKSFSE